MVYRGCVLKIEEGFAIVLTNHAKYLKIIKKDGLVVGKEIVFVKEDIYKDKRFTVKKIGLIAAVFMIMVLSMTGIEKLNILETISYAAAVVSVDINPSIEFKINKEKKVLHVEALNTDGKELIDREFKDMPIEEAVRIVIDHAKKKQYITKDKNAVLISTVAINDDFKEKTVELKKEIEEKIQEDQNLEDINLIYVQGNGKDLMEAKKQKMSIGKYEVYKQSKEKEQNITLDQIKSMKVQEMVDKEIGELKDKKVKNKVEEKVEKGISKENNNNLEKNHKATPKPKNNKTKNISLDKIKKQQKAKKEEKKEDIQQDRENKNEEIREHKPIKKEVTKIKKEGSIEHIENKKEEKKQKIKLNQENKKEKLENRKELKKEKIEKIKDAKEEKEKIATRKAQDEENKKESIERSKENKKQEKNKEKDEKALKNKNHKKNKKK
ncbi:anti-sigma factor domain-containing protein [Crassaminicella profunda]|uniref:anti-sigma factor domain-containing protein n=1 Tax=Crassaminicella profunda TaxID=1286698 RepID=UPI001CA69A89|nr:anti-sigma factor domain-containing protein [Crassaminicella profunda]QZY54240.1 anti-sigma factor domain-containing protein [Crassaminicella profunda]